MLEKRDAEQDENRSPNRQGEMPDNEEEISDDDDDFDIVDEDSDEDSNDEIIEIPDDPRHLARVAALRAENEALQARAREEEQIRTLVNGTAEQWRTNVEVIQAEVIRLRALIKEREGAAGDGGEGEGVCKPQKGLYCPRRDDDEDGMGRGKSREIE